MTYSLNTLTSSGGAGKSGRAAPDSAPVRFAHEAILFVGLVALAFWLLAMVSHSAQDAAWSTSGAGGSVANWGGRLGAWLADTSFYLLGFSVWWCFAAAVRAWLSTLAEWMRGHEPAPPAPSRLARWAASRTAFWVGLVVLLCASTALEWSRLYRFEPRLPGHGGGVLGYLVGPASVKWLGFTGSGLLGIALAVVGASLVFRFSWGHVAERLGAYLDSLVASRRERLEVAQDVEFGRQAAREREEDVIEERIEIEEHHPAPVLIEPVMVQVPKSERVAKERQKPLFHRDCPTASCRRSTCSTARWHARKRCRPKRWR